MLEKSFLRCEESWRTPPEDDELVCECCDKRIAEGDCYFENEYHLLCESCAIDKLYDLMETA